MHEEALWRNLLRKLDDVAASTGGQRLTRVRLRVGALCHLSARTLTTEWAERTQGTVANGSEVEVETSADLADPRAQGVLIISVDVQDSEAVPSSPGAQPEPPPQALREMNLS